jgi:hypothetical protein
MAIKKPKALIFKKPSLPKVRTNAKSPRRIYLTSPDNSIVNINKVIDDHIEETVSTITDIWREATATDRMKEFYTALENLPEGDARYDTAMSLVDGISDEIKKANIAIVKAIIKPMAYCAVYAASSVLNEMQVTIDGILQKADDIAGAEGTLSPYLPNGKDAVPGAEIISPGTKTALTEWVIGHGAELAVNLNEVQESAIRAILKDVYIDNPRSSAVAVKYLRKVGFGLVGRWEKNYRNQEAQIMDMVGQGKISLGQANSSLDRLWKQLIRERSRLIADTESSFAYNNGSLTAVQQSQSEGKFNGLTVEKQWVSSVDERRCATCGALHQEHVPTDDSFSTGACPPAHPACRCSLVYFAVLSNQKPVGLTWDKINGTGSN